MTNRESIVHSHIGRTIRSLAKYVPIEISIRDIRHGLRYRLVYARTGHLNPSNDLCRKAIPVDLPFRFFLIAQIIDRLCNLDAFLL